MKVLAGELEMGGQFPTDPSRVFAGQDDLCSWAAPGRMDCKLWLMHCWATLVLPLFLSVLGGFRVALSF